MNTIRFKFFRVLAATAALWLGAALPTSAQPRDLILAISEGSSGGLDHARVIAKYGGLANILGEAAKRKVVLVFAREFANLEDGMKTGKFDLVMARPSDYPARGMRDNGYRYVAHAKPDGQCYVIAAKGSPLKTLAEAKGKRWVLPEKAAYMTKFCTAELRDQGIDLGAEKVTYVKEQATVGSYVDTGLADIGGIASYSGLANNLPKTGQVLLHKSRVQPYFPLVAGKAVSKKQVEEMQKVLVNIEAVPTGTDVLKGIGIAGFDTSGAASLSALLTWLEKK